MASDTECFPSPSLSPSSPTSWVLDEPFTALDQAAVRALEQQILDFADTGGSVVLTTHHSLEHLSQVRQLDLGRVA